MKFIGCKITRYDDPPFESSRLKAIVQLSPAEAAELKVYTGERDHPCASTFQRAAALAGVRQPYNGGPGMPYTSAPSWLLHVGKHKHWILFYQNAGWDV